jgi:DNA-binding NtrC family response regulator
MTELKTILHVDDDEDILEITRMALQLVDKFELHQCSCGRDALAGHRQGWTPTFFCLMS